MTVGQFFPQRNAVSEIGENLTRMLFNTIFKGLRYLQLKLNYESGPTPRGLRGGSAADRLLGLRVRIPPEAWMSVCCECCVFSGTGLCDGLITRPEESYRLWCVCVCDREASWMRRSWPTGWVGGCCAMKKKIELYSEWLAKSLYKWVNFISRNIGEVIEMGVCLCLKWAHILGARSDTHTHTHIYIYILKETNWRCHCVRRNMLPAR